MLPRIERGEIDLSQGLLRAALWSMRPALLEKGLHNPLLLLSDSGISIEARHGGGLLAQNVKIKVGVSADGNHLVLDFRDVKTFGISLGGDWFERFVPNVDSFGISVKHVDNSIYIGYDGWYVLGVGVQAGVLTVVVKQQGA